MTTVANEAVKNLKLQRDSSSSCSSMSSGDVDHTYNPYSFKKLEKAIFNQKRPAQAIVEEEEEKIILQSLEEARRGKTDWTMDLPKINYGADDDDDDESDDHSLIKVEDIELSSDEERR